MDSHLPTRTNSASFWDYLHDLRMNNKLCDIQLLIRAKHPLEEYIEDFAVADCIQAHKVVLAASSQFFRKCLEKGDLLNLYNFDGVQSKNMQLLIDYMYHQVPWSEIVANEEASEVARILEVIQYEEPTNQLDYLRDTDGKKILVIRAKNLLKKPNDTQPKPDKPNRVFIDDWQGELRRHNLLSGREKHTTDNPNPLVVTNTQQAMGTSIVTVQMVNESQDEEAENIANQVQNIEENVPEAHPLIIADCDFQNFGTIDSNSQTDNDHLVNLSQAQSAFDDAASIVGTQNLNSPTNCSNSETGGTLKPGFMKHKLEGDLKQTPQSKESVMFDLGNGTATKEVETKYISSSESSRYSTRFKGQKCVLVSMANQISKRKKTDANIIDVSKPTDIDDASAGIDTTQLLKQEIEKVQVIQIKKISAEGLTCPECGRQFKNETGLSIHRQWKHGTADQVGQKREPNPTETFTCELCKKVVACYQALVQHMRCIHKKQVTHQCQECNIDFTTKRAYHNHIIKEHNISPYRCEICFAHFKSPEGFKIHMFKKHTAPEKTHFCKQCSQTFAMKHELAAHVKITHATIRAFKCKLCERSFKAKAPLKRHLLTYHSNQRNNQCSVCSLLFKTRTDMLNHEKKHFPCDGSSKWQQLAGNKPTSYTCSRCGKAFNKLSILLAHERQVHQAKDSGITYMCTMCEKSYSTKSYLLGHIRQAHLPRRFKCMQCLYEFPHQYMLKKHLPKCKGYPIISKPYRCTKCNRYFNLKGNLTRHIRTFGRCRRNVQSFADYIVMVKSDTGEHIELGELHDEDSTQDVTPEAIQASEALQQLQSSRVNLEQANMTEDSHVVTDMGDGEMILDNGEMFLEEQVIAVKQEAVGDSVNIEEQIPDLSNLISLPQGLRAMNIKRDSEGNVVIEVCNQMGNGSEPQYMYAEGSSIDVADAQMSENMQITSQDPPGNFIQTSAGEYVIQMINKFENEGENGQVESVQGSDDASYALSSGASHYQIGQDDCLQQLGDCTQQDSVQSVHVIQPDGSIHILQRRSDADQYIS